MADSAALSKAALKNKKRAEKRSKARIQQIKENGGVLEAFEMKDPVSLLREQLQEAKNNNNHDLAARLRQQLWIAQDNAAGVSLAEVKELGADVSSFTEEKSAIVKDTATKTTTTTTKTLPLDSQASGLTSSEKRLRALKKKLQQIEALKEKRDCGEVLEKTQLDKISKEQEITEEIEEIESLLTGSNIL